MGGGAAHLMKRIPRIKFPERHHHHHSKPSASGSASQEQSIEEVYFSSKADVPAAPINTAVGGKASLQPKRTPVSEQEIEAIMSGGCF